ncbi:hypothetical protein [Pseudomonas sp. MWU13-2105]|uniref:hypothetical protein n=1 Tax=Pseudomonas sp. MWU13-2105 TaxID=2935074 RepID=UPI00200FA9E6|nr:hypothetical protein [Pseudomonas sp. MWU13-2105]
MSRSLGLREDQQWGAELARLLKASQSRPNPVFVGAELAREEAREIAESFTGTPRSKLRSALS